MRRFLFATEGLEASSSWSMAGRHFRNEIAGLRAVAVISVVLFHLKIGGFQGGFVGVDVFVISGYLITRNILRDLSTDRFSLSDSIPAERARPRAGADRADRCADNRCAALAALRRCVDQ